MAIVSVDNLVRVGKMVRTVWNFCTGASFGTSLCCAICMHSQCWIHCTTVGEGGWAFEIKVGTTPPPRPNCAGHDDAPVFKVVLSCASIPSHTCTHTRTKFRQPYPVPKRVCVSGD